MSEVQETGRIDDLLPYLNEIEVEKVKSPMHIRFGEEEES